MTGTAVWGRGVLLEAWRTAGGPPILAVERDARGFSRIPRCSTVFSSLYGIPTTCGKTLRLLHMALVPHLLNAILKIGKGITKYLSASCICVSGV